MRGEVQVGPFVTTRRRDHDDRVVEHKVRKVAAAPPLHEGLGQGQGENRRCIRVWVRGWVKLRKGKSRRAAAALGSGQGLGESSQGLGSK